jgi:hypothetical protein
MPLQTDQVTEGGPVDAASPAAGDATRESLLPVPRLFVCHGDDGGPSFHPCRRVQEALRAAGIEYTKVIAGHGSPIPFLRRDARDELQAATGTRKLPTLKLRDGEIITNSRAILDWVISSDDHAPLKWDTGACVGRSSPPEASLTCQEL